MNLQGRSLRFANTSYAGSPRTGWGTGACMGEDPVDLSVFGPKAFPPGATVHDDLMFAASPDSYSFQHFLDRVAVMLGSTPHLRSNATAYITQDEGCAAAWAGEGAES